MKTQVVIFGKQYVVVATDPNSPLHQCEQCAFNIMDEEVCNEADDLVEEFCYIKRGDFLSGHIYKESDNVKECEGSQQGQEPSGD